MPKAGRRCAKCGQSYAQEVLYCPSDGFPLADAPRASDDELYLDLCIAGQFEVREFLGQGAMARVYRAHQRGIERDVAVKIVHQRFLENPGILSRFHQEARVSGRLSHPNVVQVHAVGELERTGEPYMVLEYLDGISLRSALAAAHGELSISRAIHIVLQVCDAVGEAHQLGILHRDVKPENVMLVQRGDDPDFVKVLDFGLAKQELDTEVKTHAGAVLGTPRYMSPEGAHGEVVGAPGDVYSIATLLFECLAGRTPFEAESSVMMLVKQTSEPAPDIRDVAPSRNIGAPLAELILKNLSKDPRERCKDAREFGRALMLAARAAGLSADELLPRSTLLGAHATLKLASVTRSHSGKVPTDPMALELQRTELLKTPPTVAIASALSPEIDANLAAEPRESSQLLRRLLLVVLCFAFGAFAALGVAKQLGAFDEPSAPGPTHTAPLTGGRT